MRTIFVINPKAGKGKGIDKLVEKIRTASEKTGIKADVYMTKAVGDAEAFADLIGKETSASAEEVRLIACGGDGTLNEVLNGAIKYENLTVGVVPIGTGNDFCRNFPDEGDFLDIEAQLKGRAIKCDAIRYSGLLDGEHQTRFCANMFNIGFDCNVVDQTAKLKKYPLMTGSFAYLMGVAITYIKKKGARLRVELDGKVIEDGPLLLTAIANGGFCGGGVHSSPYASVTDGIMDANVIYNVSRMDFLKKFPYYAKGTHMELPNIDHIIYAGTCRSAKVTPLEGTMRLCTDGEVVDAGEIEFEVVPAAFNLLVPAVI